MKSQQFQIIVPSVSLRKTKNKINIIDTQLLFGETFKVEFFRDDWAYGFNAFDNYKGWISKDSLGFLPEFNYVISNPRSVVTSKPNVRSNFLKYLSLGSKIFVNKIENEWAQIRVSLNSNVKYGYLTLKHIIQKDKYLEDWVRIAESLVGIPYRWGGRDSLGLDCSALVQLSMMFGGIILPRDSLDQFKFFSKSNFYNVYSDENKITLSRGDIIYWKGHIGVMINNKEIVHSSASHGCVLIENLDKIKERIKTRCRIIKKL